MSIYTKRNLFYLDNNGNVGIGTNKPMSVLDFSEKSEGIALPSGTTLQRPTNPPNGLLRYNTTLRTIEVYIDKWISLDNDYNILTDVSPKLLTSTGATAVVSGSGFIEGMTFQLLGRNGQYISIPTWTLNSSTQVTITRPDISSNIQPYSLVATLPSGESYTLENVITVAVDYNNQPVPPTITSFIPSVINRNVNANSYTITYEFTGLTAANAPITWSIDNSGNGNINSSSGVLVLTFNQGVSKSGSLTVTATNTYGSSSQTWNYNIINEGKPSSITPVLSEIYINTLSSNETRQYTFSAAGQGDSSVTWSITPITYGDISSGTGYLNLQVNQGVSDIGTFIVTATTLYGSQSLNISYIMASASYRYTSHTFTNAGATGQNGPTLVQLQTAYASQSWVLDSSFFTSNSGIQVWTIPQTGTYSIVVAGAAGGSDKYNAGGSGMILSGFINLTIADKLYIIVGQKGSSAPSGNGAGSGGGGTFVYLNTISLETLLFAAGGGGGSTSGNQYQKSPGSSATTSAPSLAGSQGRGYYQNGNYFYSGGSRALTSGGGGGGWSYSGTNGGAGSNGVGGYATSSGNTGTGGGGGGGTGNSSSTFLGGSGPLANGGFGGGGAAGGGFGGGGGGGGGGYGGGGGGGGGGLYDSNYSNAPGGGGGGSSFGSANLTNYNNNYGTNANHGYVTITII